MTLYRIRRRGQWGHNLLEMIIASFIFGTVTLGLTTVWIQHSKTMARAGGRLVGQFLADQMMEQSIAAGFYAVDALTTPRDPIEMKETVRDVQKIVRYQPSVTVVNVPATGTSGEMKLVTVKVEWDEQGGKGSIEYTSQLAKSGSPPP